MGEELMDAFAHAAEAAAWIRAATGWEQIQAALVLGSGWGPLTHSWGAPAHRLRLADVPHFRAPVAEGHRGDLLLFDLDGTRVGVLSGRTHLYEGHGVRPVVHGVRTAAALGATRLLLTNANGSLRGDAWPIGTPVLIRDHLNLTGVSPIEGASFVDLTDAWSTRLRAAARELDPSLPEGVYAQLRGPHYNTFAEADWLRRIGADLVGMSTVPELIAARECSLEVLGLSIVTAIEGSHDREIDGGDIDATEVVATAERAAVRLGSTVRTLLTFKVDP